MESSIYLGDFQIKPESLHKERELGQGSYGTVFKGTWDSTEVAIKTLDIKILTPNVEKEFWDEPLCLVMELMNQSLYQYLATQLNEISWDTKIKICLDIVSGLKYIHEKKIVHRDLKSLNVLLDGQLKAKITDFGLSRVKLESKSIRTLNSVGTLRWMAPELMEEEPVYNYESDIFALGVTFWEIATRQIPFPKSNEAGIIRAICSNKRETIPENCPKQFAELIEACWKQDPKQRIKLDLVQQILKEIQLTFSSQPVSQSEPQVQSQVLSNANVIQELVEESVNTKGRSQQQIFYNTQQFQKISTICCNSDALKTYTIASNSFEEKYLQWFL